tara:strand:- start:2331 stop:2951 length:621 start_codon:yes stop_codon:yes gene_type:complete
MEIQRYMEKLDKKLFEVLPAEQHPPSPADLREVHELCDDAEVLDFLNKRIEETSGRSGKVCTCDDENHALRAFQKAYDAADDLCHYRGNYKGYVSSRSGTEYYQLIWNDDDNPNCSDTLDQLCKTLGMPEVGYTRGWSKYADLHYAAQCADESRDELNNYLRNDKPDAYWDEINWLAKCELTIKSIVKQYLQKFIDAALAEQLEHM